MKNHLFDTHLRRLNNLIWCWSIASESRRNSTCLVEQILEQYLATKISLHEGHSDWGNGRIRAFKENELLEALTWATLEPVVELAKTGEDYLEKKEYAKARDIFRELQNQAGMISKIKSRIGKSSRRPHPIDEMIKEILTTNPNISLENLKKRLKAQEGNSAINIWDDDSNEILSFHQDGRSARAISISGLKDRLHEIRKLK